MCCNNWSISLSVISVKRGYLLWFAFLNPKSHRDNDKTQVTFLCPFLCCDLCGEVGCAIIYLICVRKYLVLWLQLLLPISLLLLHLLQILHLLILLVWLHLGLHWGLHGHWHPRSRKWCRDMPLLWMLLSSLPRLPRSPISRLWLRWLNLADLHRRCPIPHLHRLTILHKRIWLQWLSIHFRYLLLIHA